MNNSGVSDNGNLTIEWPILAENTTLLKMPLPTAFVNFTDYGLLNLTNGTNGTESYEEPYRLPYSPAIMIFLLILTSVITSVTIIGNTLILAAFFTTSCLRRLTYYFYASLAISDLTAGILVMPFMASFTTKAYWKFGKPFCIVWLCIDMYVYAASVYHMCVICLDRFLNVKYPFWYRVRRTKKVILSFICAAWCLALLIEVPATIFYEHIRGSSIVDYTIECDVEWRDNVVITMISFVVTVIIPFFFVLILYGQIFYIIKKRRDLAATNTSDTRCNDSIVAEKADPKTLKKSRFSITARKHNSVTQASKKDETEARQSNTLLSFMKRLCLPDRRRKYSFTENVEEKEEKEHKSNVTPIRFETKSDTEFDFSYANESFELSDRTAADREKSYRNKLPRILISITNDAENTESSNQNGKETAVDENDITVLSSETVNDISHENGENLQQLQAASRNLTQATLEPNQIRESIRSSCNTPLRSLGTCNKKPNTTKKTTQSIQRAGERKAAVTLGILLGVFLVTWLPWKLTTIADSIAGDYLFPDLWYDMAIWLQYSNSMINPFLYVLRERNFKFAIRRILYRVFCCRKINDQKKRPAASTIIIKNVNMSSSSH